jgi:hypothetical protein
MKVTHRLVRFRSLPKLGGMGQVRLYPERFLSTISQYEVPILQRVRHHNMETFIEKDFLHSIP